MVLRGGFLYGAWPRTVLILIEFKFIVPELWKLVVFCKCSILPEGLKFVEDFPLRMTDSLRHEWLIHTRHDSQYRRVIIRERKVRPHIWNTCGQVSLWYTVLWVMSRYCESCPCHVWMSPSYRTGIFHMLKRIIMIHSTGTNKSSQDWVIRVISHTRGLTHWVTNDTFICDMTHITVTDESSHDWVIRVISHMW